MKGNYIDVVAQGKLILTNYFDTLEKYEMFIKQTDPPK
jgi:hypothetical protein